ncbi:MAG: DUF502 domain-containing protein [Rhodospirillales bacterium]|nr:DUF502 domain-containing protein [Rhodospirillales bacterium]
MAGKRDKQAEPRTRPPKVKRPPTPKHLRVGLAARLRNYFLAGVLVTAPVSITFWIAWNLIQFVDDKVTPFIPPRWNPESYLPFGVPGLGLVLAVVILTFIGFVTAGFVGRIGMRYGERLLDRLPVIRSVYGATKQIFETVLAQQSTAFRQVALIEYPTRGTWAVGFVTGQTVGEVQTVTDDTVINVFLPATPNPTTGFLLFVPRRDVHILDISVEEGIKLVISGGIVTPENTRQLARPVEPSEAAATETPAKPRFSPIAKLRNYFIAGILITAPISITFWLAWKFVSFVDGKVTPLIPPRWNPETYLPFDLPGLGLIVVFVGLTLIGMFAAGFTGRIIMRTGEALLARVPVVRSIYSAVKQIFQTVLAKKSKAFRKVVLFQYPRPDVWSIGFLTGRAEGHIQEIAGRDVLNVFLPTTPNPTSGFLLFVPRNEATELTMTVEEGLKMVVSGGLVTPPVRSAREDAEETVSEAPPSGAAKTARAETGEEETV